jgi:hypothetical protein
MKFGYFRSPLSSRAPLFGREEHTVPLLLLREGAVDELKMRV